jgi:hypothetical protein
VVVVRGFDLRAETERKREREREKKKKKKRKVSFIFVIFSTTIFMVSSKTRSIDCSQPFLS